jgi:GNAT superfamily N-acetyltransferase
MSKRLTVRPVAPTDLAQWETLWEGYNTFYQRTVPSEITRTTWGRFFEVDEPVHALVAEREGRLLGLVHYLFHRSTSLIGPICYLEDLFTLETVRGQGVGRALIEAVYERARSASCLQVYWQTHETNVTAMALYDQVAERSGFLVYEKRQPTQRSGDRSGHPVAAQRADDHGQTSENAKEDSHPR